MVGIVLYPPCPVLGVCITSDMSVDLHTGYIFQADFPILLVFLVVLRHLSF